MFEYSSAMTRMKTLSKIHNRKKVFTQILDVVSFLSVWNSISWLGNRHSRHLMLMQPQLHCDDGRSCLALSRWSTQMLTGLDIHSVGPLEGVMVFPGDTRLYRVFMPPKPSRRFGQCLATARVEAESLQCTSRIPFDHRMSMIARGSSTLA
jgi:hypothetical protein